MAQAAVSASRPPFWRNVGVLRIIGQVAFVAVVVLVFREMYLNATFQLDQRGEDLSFGFLDNRAGFAIKESVITYRSTMDFFRAFFVGFTNALVVGLIGIVLATVLGIVVGVLRLSPNWLLRKITQVYVEFFRNVPLAVQVIFWYAAVLLSIPRIESSISVFGLAFASNRGLALPTIQGGSDFGAWGLFVLAGVVAGALVFRWRTRINEETGQPSYRYLLGGAAVLVAAVAGYLLVGDAFSVVIPEVGPRNYKGGFQISPEFGGILIALIVYTAAFIGEIVRGSILAVSKGQKEAAEAIGLRPSQQIRYVVLPQALRIAVPPVNNQYLNLWKNTSLAFLIGYPEIINISTTMINQAASELQILGMVVVAYLLTSLAISAVMNVVNKTVALKGGRV